MTASILESAKLFPEETLNNISIEFNDKEEWWSIFQKFLPLVKFTQTGVIEIDINQIMLTLSRIMESPHNEPIMRKAYPCLTLLLCNKTEQSGVTAIVLKFTCLFGMIRVFFSRHSDEKYKIKLMELKQLCAIIDPFHNNFSLVDSSPNTVN